MSWLYSWGIEMLVLVIVVALLGGMPYLYILPTVLLMALMTLFATGVAMMLAIANVYFRDTQYLIGIVFQIWFYANPIVYPVHLVSGQSQALGSFHGITLFDLYRLNPFYHFIEAFRNLLYDNRLPELSTSLIVTILSVGAFLIGWKVFDRHQSRLAEVL